MNSEYSVIAFVFLILALVLLKRRSVLARRARDIVITPTSSIASLLNGSQARRIVEIKGKLLADGPLLKAPYSQRDCVFFHAIRQDLIEKKAPITDKHRNRRYGYLTIEEFRSSELLWVDDGTGKIAVDPLQLQIFGQRTIGSDSSIINPENAGSIMASEYASRNSASTIREEQILSAGRRVYVMGELVRGANGFAIYKPRDTDQTAMLTIRTEESMLEELHASMRNHTIGIIVSIVLGLAVLVATR